MNERIQELAEQCTSWSEGSTWHTHGVFDKEKFARLIIEECTDVAYNLLEENTGAEVVMRIREHFGVEE